MVKILHRKCDTWTSVATEFSCQNCLPMENGCHCFGLYVKCEWVCVCVCLCVEH